MRRSIAIRSRGMLVRGTHTLWVVFVLIVVPVAAHAQSGADVTLQLPGFSAFGANTTVVVPDRGTASAAHQRQAYYQRSLNSMLPGQRHLGLARGAAALQVDAQVHDPRADEAELLREVRERRATWARGSVVPIGRPQHVAADALPALRSVAELERDRAARVAARAQESDDYLRQARAARRAGKSGVAAVYYGMAANRADGEVKRAIEAEAHQSRTDSATVSRATAAGP